MGEPNDRGSVRRLLKEGGFLFAVVTAANVSNYLFHVVMTRLLGPDDYGALGALLAVVLVLSVPTGALQAVVARRTAVLEGNDAELRTLLRGTLKLTAAIGLVLAVIIAAAAPWGRSFFRVSSVAPLLLIAVFLLPSAVGPVGLGALQGAHRFRALGTAMVVGMVVKLALGVALVQMGLGITGAVIAVAVGGLAMLATALWPIRRLLPGPVGVFELSPIARETGRAALAFIAYWTLVSVDLLLVRHYHPGAVSGRYAAAALLGRAVLFLPAAIAMAVYPRFAERPGSASSKRLLVGSMAIIGALGGLASLCVLAFPGLVSTLFGRDYVGTGAVGPILTFAMTAFGLVSLLLYYFLAVARPPVKTLWIATLAQTVAIVAFSESPRAIAAVVTIVGVLLVVWLGAHALRGARVVDLATGELWERKSSFEIDLSVVTPSFNGARHIATTLASLREALIATGLRTETILVSDGSRDGTPAVAAAHPDETLRVLHYEHNQGKGYALRTGLARARGEFIAFIDSDGDLDPHELHRFIDLMRLYGADFVIGSKRHALSEVSYPWTRRVMSWGYHALVRVLFGLKVTDTQTGLKLVRRDVLAAVLPRLVEKRFAFDLELLVAARRLGYPRIIEAPVRLDYQFASTISSHAVRGILLDTAAVWYRRYVLCHYDAPAAAAVGAAEPVVSKVL